VSRQQQPGSSATRLARALNDLLFAPGAISEGGAGANVVEAITDLTRAIDRAAAAMEHYNKRREEGDA
jgi:hypothetical protein